LVAAAFFAGAAFFSSFFGAAFLVVGIFVKFRLTIYFEYTTVVVVIKF
jgi:hypothetical protein